MGVVPGELFWQEGEGGEAKRERKRERGQGRKDTIAITRIIGLSVRVLTRRARTITIPPFLTPNPHHHPHYPHPNHLHRHPAIRQILQRTLPSLPIIDLNRLAKPRPTKILTGQALKLHLLPLEEPPVGLTHDIFFLNLNTSRGLSS